MHLLILLVVKHPNTVRLIRLRLHPRLGCQSREHRVLRYPSEVSPLPFPPLLLLLFPHSTLLVLDLALLHAGGVEVTSVNSSLDLLPRAPRLKRILLGNGLQVERGDLVLIRAVVTDLLQRSAADAFRSGFLAYIPPSWSGHP